MTGTQVRRRALSSFLRSRRARLSPADVGMAPGVRRRTPGLRREELAVLAGVGVTWYTWLEQGRDINPSPEVLAALARTLRLDEAESAYLFRLAGCAPLPAVPEAAPEVPEVLRRLVESQAPAPALLVDAAWDVRAWNASAEALFALSACAAAERNLAWAVFANDAHRARVVDWERHARRTLAELRSAFGELGGESSPAGARLAALIRRLRASFPEADRWLDEHAVQQRHGTEKTMLHETVGELLIDQVALRAAGGFQLVVLAPRDEATAERLTRLASASAPAPAPA
ncbi:helix-turn-helix transcriptional regulator [Kitasatospora sp. NBC_01539]|uniref:helix-turn-helix transcriptional regulator n=1 Tax=Kitasatospora sp. NBC_01539 TaxID=2903577 RepID=UPI00386033A4